MWKASIVRIKAISALSSPAMPVKTGVNALVLQPSTSSGNFAARGQRGSSMTVIATRILMLQSNAGNVEIPINVFAPELGDNVWMCRFDIDWPEGKLERWAGGVDAVQALLQALQIIGVILYTSKHHKSGRLTWYESGAGYGFPVTSNLRDLLVGDDAKHL
jgi:hypothetical protein